MDKPLEVMVTAHQYTRDVFSAHAESLSKLSARMVRGTDVLELGPAAGYFTRILKTALNCTVDAIEIDETMAQKAKGYCRDLRVADLDTLDWSALWPERRYDAIIAADVLEHLREPERALRALRARLRPGGKLLISLPNIAYAGMIFGLLEDDFRYRAEGLLDRTHLRFFTRTTLNEMLAACGWEVTWEGEVSKDLYEAEFHTRLERWPPSLREFVLEHPSRRAYQLLCECVPARSSRPGPQRDPLPVLPRLGQFAMRLMWADDTAQLNFENGQPRFGEIGNPCQILEWTLPVTCRVLRLRLADRPGYLRVNRFWLRSAPAVRAAQDTVEVPLEKCTVSDDCARAEDLLTLGSAESWLQLPEAEYPAGTRLCIECGWPMSAEYLQSYRERHAMEVSYQQAIATLRSQEAALAEKLSVLENTLLHREALIAERDRLLEHANAHVLHLERLVAERERLVVERDGQLDAANRLREEIEGLLYQARQTIRTLEERLGQAEATVQAQRQRIAELRSFRVWWQHRWSDPKKSSPP